jgi:hypothetical protein
MKTHRFKFLCSWENSNEFFVSMQNEILLFPKKKLSESELILIPQIKLIDDPQNLHYFSIEELEFKRG